MDACGAHVNVCPQPQIECTWKLEFWTIHRIIEIATTYMYAWKECLIDWNGSRIPVTNYFLAVGLLLQILPPNNYKNLNKNCNHECVGYYRMCRVHGRYKFWSSLICIHTDPSWCYGKGKCINRAWNGQLRWLLCTRSCIQEVGLVDGGGEYAYSRCDIVGWCGRQKYNVRFFMKNDPKVAWLESGRNPLSATSNYYYKRGNVDRETQFPASSCIALTTVGE